MLKHPEPMSFIILKYPGRLPTHPVMSVTSIFMSMAGGSRLPPTFERIGISALRTTILALKNELDLKAAERILQEVGGGSGPFPPPPYKNRADVKKTHPIDLKFSGMLQTDYTELFRGFWAHTPSSPLPPVEFPSPTAQNRDNFELRRQKSAALLVYFSDRRVIVREQIIENVDKTSKPMFRCGFPYRSRAISPNFKIPGRA